MKKKTIHVSKGSLRVQDLHITLEYSTAYTDLEAFAVDNRRSGFIIFLFRYPHLQENICNLLIIASQL